MEAILILVDRNMNHNPLSEILRKYKVVVSSYEVMDIQLK